MLYFGNYVSLLFLVYALGANAVPCETEFAGTAQLPKALRLNEDEARVVARDPRYARVVRALAEIFEKRDPDFMISLAGTLIENPGYGRTGRALLGRTPFFADFPEYRGRERDITYLAIRERFGDALTTYAAGVLATLAPVVPRVVDALAASQLPMQDHASPHAPFRRLMALEVYREAVAQLLIAGGPHFTPSVRLLERKSDGAMDLVGYGEVTSKALAAALRRRKSTAEDLGNIHGILSQVASAIFMSEGSHSREKIPDFRRIFRRQAPRCLRNGLGIEKNHEAIMTAIIGAALQDPRPLGRAELEQHLLTAARRLLAPVREKAAPVAAPIVPAVAVAYAPPPARRTDPFSPPPAPKVKIKTRASVAAASDPAAPARPPTLVSIPPELDLKAFVKDAGGRAWRHLRARREYQIVFASHPNEVQTILFDDRAVEFMKAHPIEAKRIVRALGMGETAAGVKPSGLHSQRYGGVVYEIFTGGKYRPLAVYQDGVWQVIRVEHTDDAERAASFVAPIARR